MHDDELLKKIHGATWIAELLTDFDFDIARVAHGPAEPVRLPGGEHLEMVAGDAAGGAYLLVGTGRDRPVVYAGSEGEGGLIATTLRDALGLVVGLSSIHDAMAVSIDEDGGTALRAHLAEADDELRAEWPGLDDDRARLRTELGLPEADGLLEGLHHAAVDERYRPINEDGDPYESMLI